jgi:5-formaminoimidazole-4-carboxamide-1-(beta)-D-ribofuranosyl 5'-monophosphate synthetase
LFFFNFSKNIALNTNNLSPWKSLKVLSTVINSKTYLISTLGSHCSLQVLKGAKDEGFNTLLICEKKRASLYNRFDFIDELFFIDNFKDLLRKDIQKKLIEKEILLIPHGTLISNLNHQELEKINIPIIGNKWILRWESDRELKQRLMNESYFKTPRQINRKEEIKKLCIVKLHGAAGGKGYFLAWNQESFDEGCTKLIKEKVIKDEDELYIQEYVIGVPIFLQFFYSPLKNEVELLGIDRRYESDIDGIGRIPSQVQINLDFNPTYNVIGNFPVVLRESLLQEAFTMAENFVETSKKLVPPGMPGPFCIEGVYDRNSRFIVFEFSARIVAGTNLFINGSPYSDLLYKEPMSMGRRICREIKEAIRINKLEEFVT